MIKFENTNVINFEGALRGMRNPLNSWEKSDSDFIRPNESNCDGGYDHHGNYNQPKCPLDCERVHFKHLFESNRCFEIGTNDLNLAQRLIKAGPDHRKFLRQIFVSVDITAPLYWWKEFDTYKVATVANSCSTMHKIRYKPIELSDFSIDDFYIEGNGIDLRDCFINVVADCESLRRKYLETKDKKYWRGLIQLLPESYNQKRTVTLNYETLRNIYGSRRNHKLDEWSIGFMEWIDSLPYAEELIKFS